MISDLTIKSKFTPTFSVLMFGFFLGFNCVSSAAETAASGVPAITTAPAGEQPAVLRFAINHYIVDGATLLTAKDFDQVVAPYVGKNKDFSDVQHALEAVEELYAQRGFSAVHVLLPEQELQAGTVRFQVIESRFGKVTVKDNHFTSEANVLRAIPSVHPGVVPIAKEISSELRLANENPARQMNVVLKSGEQDDTVDASIVVIDSKPSTWNVTADNSGTTETGESRVGLSYRYANLFDRDNVAQLQTQISPQYMDRVRVFGGSYKIPFYASGNSLEFFAGYSNINSLVGGLSNFQGGGELFSSLYNVHLDRWGSFDPSVTFGLDWRKFSKIEMTNPPPVVLYNDIVVTPLSMGYTSKGKVGKGEVNFNGTVAVNVPAMSQSKSADFANYDQVSQSNPTPAYKVFRYGAGYFYSFASDWQFRTALNGQWSGDTLIQGEQMRLGGADGVRGFAEGSETGAIGARLNFEAYTSSVGSGRSRTRFLVFMDNGMVRDNIGPTTTIAGSGVGLRSAFTDQFSLRIDAGRIMKAGNDPAQVQGDWRIHAALSATF
jgi:hemolysin activation/secretion protein